MRGPARVRLRVHSRLVIPLTRITLALLLAAVSLAGCMPLPPEGGGVDVGARSDQWAVRFDPQLGSPVSLINRSLDESTARSGTAIDDATAEAAVRAVFRSRPEWFAMRAGVDDFRPVRSEARGWLRFMRFEQTYHGLSVAGAGYDARILPNGRVGSLEGSYRPGLTLEVRPLLSEMQAEDRARSAIGSDGRAPGVPGVQYEVENGLRAPRTLMLMPVGGVYRLVWAVVVPVGTQDHARVYVDARDGTALGRQFVGWVTSR